MMGNLSVFRVISSHWTFLCHEEVAGGGAGVGFGADGFQRDGIVYIHFALERFFEFLPESPHRRQEPQVLAFVGDEQPVVVAADV